MIWRRRQQRAERDVTRPAPVSAPPASEETRRAKAAAREAAIQLDQVRAQRPRVEQSHEEIDDLNHHNGFYALIRNAFGA